MFYIEDHHSSQKWKLGSIGRSGRAFWSEDSKRLFLRDEYAADDTKIRVFDVSSPVPKEIKGLNRRMQKAIFAQIPLNKTTLWLYYPQVCFASNDSSTIIALADAPLVPKKESGSGTPFRVKLTINLVTLKVVSAVPEGYPTHPIREESLGAFTAPVSWHEVAAGAFSLFAPLGWEFHQLTGVDSYRGEFVCDGVVLLTDLGRYSGSFKDAREPAYRIAHEIIGGYPAKIVSPRTPGHGVTGVYINVGDSTALCIYGKDLTSTQQELVLKMFQSIRFGGAEPQYVVPPPPPSPENVQ
ncbi:MAG: hypothetical protein WB780_10790 [Candidatus Acidiferrales bacterium]